MKNPFFMANPSVFAFSGGGSVPLAAASVLLRSTGSLSAATPPMPFSFTSTGRSPRGLPLPPLCWDESLVLVKRMAKRSQPLLYQEREPGTGDRKTRKPNSTASNHSRIVNGEKDGKSHNAASGKNIS